MIKDDSGEGGAGSGVGDVQSCQAAEIGSDERERQSQMSDIFDVPVGTRSRRCKTQSTERQNLAKLEPDRADDDARLQTDSVNIQQGLIEDSTPSPCDDTVIVRVRLALIDASQSSYDDGGALVTSLPKIVLSKIGLRDRSGSSASSPSDSHDTKVFVSVHGSRVSDEPLLSSRLRRDDKSILNEAKVPETTMDEPNTLGTNVPLPGGDTVEQNGTKLVENRRELVDVSRGDIDEECSDVLCKKTSESDMKKSADENDLSSIIHECSTEASPSISFDLQKERPPSPDVAIDSGAPESSEGMTSEKKDSTTLQGCTITTADSDLHPDVRTTSLAVNEHGVCGVRQSSICEAEAEAAGHPITHRSQAKTATIPFIPMTQQVPDFDYMTQVGLTRYCSVFWRSTLTLIQQASPRKAKTAEPASAFPPSESPSNCLLGGNSPSARSSNPTTDRGKTSSIHSHSYYPINGGNVQTNCPADTNVKATDPYADRGPLGSSLESERVAYRTCGDMPSDYKNQNQQQAEFRFAGSSEIISVSDESKARAEEMFGQCTVRVGGPTSPPAKACSLNTHEEMPSCSKGREGCGVSSIGNAKLSFPGFSTAGQSNPIIIPEDQLARASLLLDGDSPMRAEENPAAPSNNRSSKAWSIYDDKEESRDCCEQHSATFGAVEIFEEENHAREEGCVKESLPSQLDARESAPHLPDLTAGFCIAGSSKAITVSADQMATATSLLLGGHEQSENAGQQHFQIAKRDKNMSVSDYQLKQPAKPCTDDKHPSFLSGALAGSTGKAGVSSGFECAGSNRSISLSGDQLPKTHKRLDGNEGASEVYEANRRDSLLIEVGATIGFRTAGRSQTISVSEEQLANARGLLSDGPFEDPGTAVPLHPMRQTPSQYRTGASNTEPIAGASSSLKGFQMAGSGKTVAIAEESMKKVESLFGDGNGSQPQKLTSKPSDGQIGFKTAGNNKAIAVSSEHLSIGEQVLLGRYDTNSKGSDTPSTDGKGSNRFVRGTGIAGNGLNPAESRKMISSPKEESAVAGQVFKDNCSSHPSDVAATSVPSFATAGTGNSISVSKEEMAKAGHLLKDDVINPQSSKKIPGDSETPGLGTSAFALFRSAGSDTRIRICEEHINRASDLLSRNGQPPPLGELSNASVLPTTGFQIAGSGKSIQISEEQMRNAQRLITDESESRDQAGHKHKPRDVRRSAPTMADRVDDVAKCGFAKTKANSAEESAFSSGACDIETDSAAAKPRVRFSLDSTNNGNGRALAPAGFSFAGSARKVPVNQASLDRASRLFNDESSDFATPNSDQQNTSPHAKMKENFADNCHVDVSSSLPHDGPNIVTETKCAISRLKDRNDSTKVQTSTPPTAVSHTPLQEIPAAFDETLQSVMKSKRLFGESQSGSKECRSGKDEEEGAAQQHGNFAGVDEYYKITLRRLARGDVRKITWKGCIEHGLQEVTLRISSTNATKLRFKREDGSPLFLFGQGVPPKCAYTGKVAELNDWLIDQGCDESLLCTKWIQNHYRWIVWKLAAMERRFPMQLGGQYLNYGHVLSQLKSRYERELVAAKRPAVRKILNKDVAAGIPIILCVSQVLRFRSKEPDGGVAEELRLELTDGWYSIPALVDSVLAVYVEKGKIQVGSKIAVCNAQLAGSDDGVDPLDDSYDSSKRGCPLLLRITANSTRPAKWHSRLGFVPPTPLENHAGTILVKSLDDIHPDGGSIPAIDLVVCKAYHRMYREQLISENKQIVATNHLTEAEESSRQREFDSKDRRAREKLADAAQKECSKVRLPFIIFKWTNNFIKLRMSLQELEEDAPLEWKEMVESNSPEEHYEKLSDVDRKIVDDWSQRRTVLLQSMVSKSVEHSMADHSTTERVSIPYVKVLVKALFREPENGAKRGIESRQHVAELTAWRVTDDHLAVLREGNVVRMKSLNVKSDGKGLLQLSSKADTPMELLTPQPSRRQLIRSGYEERSALSFIRLNLLSKQKHASRIEREVDFVGVIVKIEQEGDNSSKAYLTDESGLVVSLTRNHTADCADPFHIGNVDAVLPAVAEVSNVQISSFNANNHCVRCAWGLATSRSRLSSNGIRRNELECWHRTSEGKEVCKSALDRLNAGVTRLAGPASQDRLCFGYLMGFELDRQMLGTHLCAILDVGDEELMTVLLPMGLLAKTLHLLKYEAAPIPNPFVATTFDPRTLELLNIFCRANQRFIRLSAKLAASYSGDVSLLEAVDVSIGNVDELSRLYLHKEKYILKKKPT